MMNDSNKNTKKSQRLIIGGILSGMSVVVFSGMFLFDQDPKALREKPQSVMLPMLGTIEELAKKIESIKSEKNDNHYQDKASLPFNLLPPLPTDMSSLGKNVLQAPLPTNQFKLHSAVLNIPLTQSKALPQRELEIITFSEPEEFYPPGMDSLSKNPMGFVLPKKH